MNEQQISLYSKMFCDSQWTTFPLRFFFSWGCSRLLSPLLTLSMEHLLFFIHMELAGLLALGMLPWKWKKHFWPGPLAFSLAVSSSNAYKPRASLKEFSLVSPPLCGSQPWPVPTAQCVSVSVCVCLHEQSFPWERGVENRDRGHIYSLWDCCKRSSGHKGDLIHHVMNSLELSPRVSGHHVIRGFLTKVILGRGTWAGPIQRHLGLLNKVHDASSKLLVDFYDSLFLYSCAIFIMSLMDTLLCGRRVKVEIWLIPTRDLRGTE